MTESYFRERQVYLGLQSQRYGVHHDAEVWQHKDGWSHSSHMETENRKWSKAPNPQSPTPAMFLQQDWRSRNLPKHYHQLGISCSSTWAYGRHFSVKPPHQCFSLFDNPGSCCCTFFGSNKSPAVSVYPSPLRMSVLRLSKTHVHTPKASAQIYLW